MARKIITHEVVVDDLTGVEIPAEDAETVQFSVLGKTYELDLGPQSRVAFDAAFAPLVSAARTVGRGGGKAKRQADTRTRPNRAESAGIRKWARANGYDVADRGRIGDDVVNAYRARHSQPVA